MDFSEKTKKALFHLKDITLSYPSGKEIFSLASLTVYEGDAVGLWSPNGTGKTTFFKLLTGLMKPQSGALFFEGREPLTHEEWRNLRLKVGYVLQHPDDQLFFPEVIDDVAFGPLNQGLSEKEALLRSQQALDALGIGQLAHELSFELSGGQKKMVTLACVLSMRPSVLLLDEPTNGLDEESAQRLTEIIRGFKGTKMIISHDPVLLNSCCSTFYTIRDKKFEKVSAPRFHEHSHEHFFGEFAHSHAEQSSL